MIPALQAFAFDYGRTLELHWAWQYFLLLLVLVGLLNYLVTRHAISAFVIAVSQCVLLADHLPISMNAFEFDVQLVFVIGVNLAIVIAVLFTQNSPRKANALDRVWIDFRDALGVVWGLRIMERVNQLAVIEDWPVRLTWHGFKPMDGKEGVPIPSNAIEKCFRTLLRRFFYPDWITNRMNNIER